MYSRNVDSINSVRVASCRICQIRYSGDAGSDAVAATEVNQSHSPEVLEKNHGGKISTRHRVECSPDGAYRSDHVESDPPAVSYDCTCP